MQVDLPEPLGPITATNSPRVDAQADAAAARSPPHRPCRRPSSPPAARRGERRSALAGWPPGHVRSPRVDDQGQTGLRRRRPRSAWSRRPSGRSARRPAPARLPGAPTRAALFPALDRSATRSPGRRAAAPAEAVAGARVRGRGLHLRGRRVKRSAAFGTSSASLIAATIDAQRLPSCPDAGRASALSTASTALYVTTPSVVCDA